MKPTTNLPGPRRPRARKRIANAVGYAIGWGLVLFALVMLAGIMVRMVGWVW